MKKPIKIAIVGLGRAGWTIHAMHIRQRRDCKIVAVADTNTPRLREAAEELKCEAYTDLNRILKKSEAELVVVATPSVFHQSDALKVLRSGRHCIVEKPMALNTRGAYRMLQEAIKNRKKLFVHQNYRFHREYQHLREIIESEILGRVFAIRACWFSYARRNDWQTLRKNGGGTLNNTCPHAIDMVLSLLNSPVVRLMGDLQCIKDAGDAEDHAQLFMKARNGRTADITVSTACALPSPKWMLLGSCGTLSTDGETSTLRYYDPRKVARLAVTDGMAPGRVYGNQENLPWKLKMIPSYPKRKYPSFYDNVVEVLTARGTMVVPPAQAAEVVRITEWARKGMIPRH